jgi:hypothetical protein
MNEFRPIGTYGLLGVYILVFIAFNLISYDYESALRAGAQESVLVATGEWWRLISSMFMHFGLLHIAFNGFFLTRIGPLLEFELGTERFLAVFLVSGLGGSAAAGIVYGPVQLCGGASGGLFGMMGALLAVYSREERSYGMALRDPRVKGILSPRPRQRRDRRADPDDQPDGPPRRPLLGLPAHLDDLPPARRQGPPPAPPAPPGPRLRPPLRQRGLDGHRTGAPRLVSHAQLVLRPTRERRRPTRLPFEERH